MEHPSRLVARGAVAAFGAALVAGVILFGPVPLGRAIAASRDGSSLPMWDPDVDVPLPADDEPALDAPAFDSPLHPPGAHRHRHHPSAQPGRS
jgi:hypothetical protein